MLLTLGPVTRGGPRWLRNPEREADRSPRSRPASPRLSRSLAVVENELLGRHRHRARGPEARGRPCGQRPVFEEQGKDLRGQASGAAGVDMGRQTRPPSAVAREGILFAHDVCVFSLHDANLERKGAALRGILAGFLSGSPGASAPGCVRRPDAVP